MSFKWKLWWWAQLPFLPSWVRNRRNLRIARKYAKNQRRERLDESAINKKKAQARKAIREATTALNEMQESKINTENKP